MKKFGGDRRAQAVFLFWAVVAAVSLAQGFVTSFKAGQSQDLGTVSAWLSTWLRQGASPYYPPTGLAANYPPHAIAFLSPLALIPESWAAPFWSVLNLALAPVAGILAVKVVKPDATKRAALFVCVLFLSWAGLRIGLANGQFTLLLVSFGLLAVLVVDKRPVFGGVLLALALMKPHVGAAFFLWAVLTRRFKAAAVSIAVMFAGLLVFSLRVGQSPLTVTTDFLSVLRQQFGGETFLGGVFELRPLVHAVVPGFLIAEVASLVILLGLLALIVVVGLGKIVPDRKQRDVIVLELCCLWVLMAVFHNPYDALLFLPVATGLYFCVLAQAGHTQTRQDKLALWLLQFALVLEIPGLWWKLSARFNLSVDSWAGQWLSHFDRALVVLFFAYFVNRLRLSRHVTHKRGESGEVFVKAPANEQVIS